MPTVHIPITSSQQGGISSSSGPNNIIQVQTLVPTISPPVQTSNQCSTPSVHLEPALVIPNRSNAIGEGASIDQRNVTGDSTSSQNNTIGEGESNSNPEQQTLVFLSVAGTCSNRICESFKSELDPKGTTWKSVPQETKYFYLGEFEKEFYWDPSIDSEVKIQWRRKAARRYSDFISGLKKKGKWTKYISEEIWESWMSIWKKLEVIEKSKINSRNRCGGQDAVAKGTHTGGSITIGEHRKRLAIKNGRDQTPSEIHLHVHTHGHDGKSFVGERAQIVHEKYQEILQNQTQTQSEVDQWKAYYQAAGGEKKRRIYGLGAQAKVFYGPNFRVSSRSDASGSVPCPKAQTTPTENMDELVTQLPHPSTIAPVIPAPTAKNIDEDRASLSKE
ncbi:uncharacterized protein LOC125854555 [Solanum stenotomum]|uniref:uncharacterized protein LOC125854555 n=1 Tax=Solanum stenotomum TaxID=172797 RepID=UPI0020D0C5E6|nr:uncharacterized protein LOC125854555 [Solanum stenotomum]